MKTKTTKIQTSRRTSESYPDQKAAERARAGRLLAWYDAGHRALPWRLRGGDPWAIWVSEVMLQQTRVATVLERYDEFLREFPDVATFARANEDRVLAAWSGLGYYRRVRQMHAASREIVDQGRGELPASRDQWLTLPGVGPYTAAAIASIAQGENVAVVDGNVERVISRLLGLTVDPRSADGRRTIAAKAHTLLVEGRPGDSNQAMMELGATLCLPRGPRCEECPLSSGCAAFRSGNPEQFPAARVRPATQRIAAVALVVRRTSDRRILLFRRAPHESLMAGLWELPWFELASAGPEGSPTEVLAERYGGMFGLGETLGQVRHAITFRDLRFELRAGSWSPDGEAHGGEVREGSPEVGWFDENEIAALPRSALLDKALERANGRRRSP